MLHGKMTCKEYRLLVFLQRNTSLLLNEAMKVSFIHWKYLIQIGSYYECHCGRHNYYFQVYHDVIGQIISPHLTTFDITLFQIQRLADEDSWISICTCLQSFDASYIPSQHINSWRLMTLMSCDDGG